MKEGVDHGDLVPPTGQNKYNKIQVSVLFITCFVL